MDAYAGYVEHNLPLVLLSGLGERQSTERTRSPSPRQDSGTRISTTSPECRGDRADQLLDQLLRQDGSDSAWNPQALPGPSGAIKYCMQPIGRVGRPTPGLTEIASSLTDSPGIHTPSAEGGATTTLTWRGRPPELTVWPTSKYGAALTTVAIVSRFPNLPRRRLYASMDCEASAASARPLPRLL